MPPFSKNILFVKHLVHRATGPIEKKQLSTMRAEVIKL